VNELLRPPTRHAKTSNDCVKKGRHALEAAPNGKREPIVLDVRSSSREPSLPKVSANNLQQCESIDDCTYSNSDEHQQPKLAALLEHQQEVSNISPAKEDDDNGLQIKTNSLAPTVLDVDFARVTLRSSGAWPKYEFYIEGLESIITTNGAMALLDFLDFVLNLPEVVTSGFVLTYDVRNLMCPQLDLMSWIMRYIVEPQHEEAWQQRCVCCKVIVQSGMYYSVAESFFSFLFSVYQPPCRVFLATDLDEANRETWRCFKPNDEIDEGLGLLSSIGSGFFDVLLPPFPHETPAQQRASPHSVESVSESVILTQPLQPAEREEEAQASSCPESLEVDFCTLTQGFDEAKKMGYLIVVGNSKPMLDVNLAKVMDFMDAFVNSRNAQQGFSITYDLRKLGIPSMSQIMRVADWGKNSVRQDKWMKLNIACKIVVTAGIRFTMTTAVLKSFFYICPPVCRTVVLTSPDEPEENGTVFLPPSDPTDRESFLGDSHSDDGSTTSCGCPADASESTTAEQDTLGTRSKLDFSGCESESQGEKPKVRCVDHVSWQPTDTHSWIPDSFHVAMW
jgi:hypothetical protein